MIKLWASPAQESLKTDDLQEIRDGRARIAGSQTMSPELSLDDALSIDSGVSSELVVLTEYLVSDSRGSVLRCLSEMMFDEPEGFVPLLERAFSR